MSFVIYDINTTRIQKGTGAKHRRFAFDAGCDEYKTEAAAKSALSREKRIHPDRDLSTLAIIDKKEFNETIDKKEVVYSLMDVNHEHPIIQSVNTPRCCDPSSELYWSM